MGTGEIFIPALYRTDKVWIYMEADMKMHSLQFPVLVDDLGWTDDPRTLQAISTLLPEVKAGTDADSGDFILVEEAAPLARTKRLVVLIPEHELDENGLARRIWQIAAPGALEVLLLSRSPEPGTEAYLRLRLASLASLVRDERVIAGFTFATGKTWVEAVERVKRPGDLLVCLEDQKASSRLKPGLDPGTQLFESLKAPVYFMNGLSLGPSLRQLRRRKEWVAWVSFLTTLAVFGWAQLQINRAMAGYLWTFFMMLSVLVEIAILWEINEHIQ
jgi:hypothetical protein